MYPIMIWKKIIIIIYFIFFFYIFYSFNFFLIRNFRNANVGGATAADTDSAMQACFGALLARGGGSGQRLFFGLPASDRGVKAGQTANVLQISDFGTDRKAGLETGRRSSAGPVGPRKFASP